MLNIPEGITAYNIKIVNIQGKELLQQEVKGSAATIDVSTLPKGIYIVKVVGDRVMQAGKFIKK